MKEKLEAKDDEAEVGSLAVWDCGSPLYDSYELVSLNHLIERHLMALPSLGRSKRLTNKLCDASNVRATNDTRKAAASIMRSLSLSDYVSGTLLKERVGQDKSKTLKVICRFCKSFSFWKK